MKLDVRASPAEYLALDLRAHDMMRGMPLHDVSVVDLPGGGAGRTVGEVHALMKVAERSFVVSALMGLRCAIGRMLRWDTAEASTKDSFVSRVSDADRRASELAPGTQNGLFRVLYQFPREALGEIRNATVHAFLSTVLVPTPTGYRFYWAVYVKPTSWLTPAYLAAIEPFRRLLVYPALLRRISAAWVATYG